MKQKIHPEGPEFSRMVLGAWRWADQPFSLSDRRTLLDTALSNGITTIDHADIYGNYECERLFGEVIKDDPSLRDKVEIVTKCGIKLVSDKYPERKHVTYDTSAEHIISSAENSLKQLAIDSIDLLLIHRPDPLMHPDEVARAFYELKDSGKVKHFGVSNFTIPQFELLQSRLAFPLVTNQIELSLTYTDLFFEGIMDYLFQHNVSPMAWSPFGGGKLFSDEELFGKLKPLAEKYNVNVGALVLAWLLHHPAKIFPVVGTSNWTRIEGLVEAEKVSMEKSDWFYMLREARGYDVP